MEARDILQSIAMATPLTRGIRYGVAPAAELISYGANALKNKAVEASRNQGNRVEETDGWGNNDAWAILDNARLSPEQLIEQYKKMPDESRRMFKQNNPDLATLAEGLVSGNITLPPRPSEDPTVNGLNPNASGLTNPNDFRTAGSTGDTGDTGAATASGNTTGSTTAGDEGSGGDDMGGSDGSDGSTDTTGSTNAASKKYEKSMYGILQAMENGDISKDTGLAFLVDALGNFASNLGKRIGNVGAQFTGGTVDNNYGKSLWEQRRDAMFGNELTSELNKQEGTDREMQYEQQKKKLEGMGLDNEKADRALEASRYFSKLANDTTIPASIRNAYKLLASASTGDIGTEEWLGLGAGEFMKTEDGKKFMDAVTTTVSSLGDAASGVLNTVSNIAKTGGSVFDIINAIFSAFGK